MTEIRWSPLKSKRLKKTRGVSFAEILQAKLIDVKGHPRLSGQKIMLFEYQSYIWVVPYVETGQEIFLKTLYPSRKYTKIYRQGGLP